VHMVVQSDLVAVEHDMMLAAAVEYAWQVVFCPLVMGKSYVVGNLDFVVALMLPRSDTARI
jgi:hypothetical protein